MKPGDVLDGRYEIVRPIGRGGMGAVYEAIQRDLGRRVAVKVIETGAEVVRLAQEARALAALNHPNVVTILDSRPDASPPFLAMDLVPGRSLDAVIAERGRLEPRRAAILAMQLTSALDAAHRAGIIHRDVKPSNVLVVEGGPMNDLVKVVDFGVAKLTIDPMKQTTRGVVVGSLAYMAPEQILGKPLDARVDVFAAGVTLYEMLSGRPPFDGESLPQVAAEICQGEPPVLVAPPPLVAIVQRAMRKDPDARFASAEEMKRALEAFVSAPSGHYSAPPFGIAPSALASTSGPSALASTHGPSGPPGAFGLGPSPAIAPTAPMALPVAMPTPLPHRPPPRGMSQETKILVAVVGAAAVFMILGGAAAFVTQLGKTKPSTPLYDGATVAMDMDPASKATQAEEDAIRRKLGDFARCFRTTNLPRGSTLRVQHLREVALLDATNGVDLAALGCADLVDRQIAGVRAGVTYRVRF